MIKKYYLRTLLLLISFVSLGRMVCSEPVRAVPNYAEDYSFITNDGAWCWFSDPRAIYIDNKIFGGFVDKEGSIWAFSYDPANQKRQQYKLYDKLNYDDHANPSIMQLEDKRIVLFFSAHGGTVNSPIYYAISKKPADISSWEDVRTINPKMEGKLPSLTEVLIRHYCNLREVSKCCSPFRKHKKFRKTEI